MRTSSYSGTDGDGTQAYRERRGRRLRPGGILRDPAFPASGRLDLCGREPRLGPPQDGYQALVPDYAGSASAVIDAPASEIFSLMLDYEQAPEWMGSVRSVQVLSRDEDGRGLEVAYEIDVRVGVVRYTLRHHYEPPQRISSVYVEGDFRDCEGQWTFRDVEPGRAEACFELRIDPGRSIPGPVVKMLGRRVMKGSVEDLRRHFATPAGRAR